MKVPVTIGLEIEANWPQLSHACSEFKAAVAKVKPNPIVLQRATSGYGGWTDSHIITVLSMMHGTRRVPVAHHDGAKMWKWYEEALPPRFHFPKGVHKSVDGSCGMEIKFENPAKTQAEAEALVGDMCSWMRDVGVPSFDQAGTHIHFGHDQFLRTGLNNENRQDPIRFRAEALLMMAFASRERAIFQLMPPSRHNNGYCQAHFTSPVGEVRNALSPDPLKLTAADVHNNVLSRATLARVGSHCRTFGIFTGGSLQSFRRHPTMEMRYFPGTHNAQQVKGYLRLMADLWDRLAPKCILEENLKTVTDSDVVVNPYTFTVEKLYEEVSSPWLKKWINATYGNHGQPVTENIPDEIVQSAAVPA